ncbi:MAG: alginate export family protein [Proteobacteria bacterium]|nr:alginate export family protein [Pseudomonadota bacterium]
MQTPLRALRSRLTTALVAGAALLIGAGGAFAQGSPTQPASPQPAPAKDPLTYTFADGHIKFGLEAGFQVVGEARAFWNLSHTFAPASRFKTTLGWGEAYLKPGFTFEKRLGSGLALYGGASLVAARTLGRDIFDIQDKGRVLLENAYAGAKFGTPGSGFYADVSAGAQPYRIGTGMLIADGGQDGFERGALIFGPRAAWAMTGIARLGHGAFSAEGFYLDANEYASNNSKSTLAGVNFAYAPAKGQNLGLALGKVLTSLAPYPQAAPGGVGIPAILMDARKDLAFLNAYGRWNPVSSLPGLWIAGDFAYQWNDRIDMRAWGARGEIGYAFSELPFSPTLSYAWQTFSGDNPNTRRLERFDPLFYDGSPAGWATGSNGSFMFINSNVNAHRATLALYASARDILTFRYAHVRANQLNSPVQFGQATRFAFTNGVPGLIAGVRKAHLSDEFLAEYTRILTPNAFLSFGFAYSVPGAGLRGLATSRLPDWYAGFANLVIKY